MDGASKKVRNSYDAVARTYATQLGDELTAKPLDRAMLATMVELAGGGIVADVGCGPGHVTKYLADLGASVVGVDLSTEMVRVAADREPSLRFVAGSMLALPVRDGSWAAAVALYSIIHFTPDERRRAFTEFARVLRPEGRLLVSFHVESPDFPTGAVDHLSHWFGADVDLDGYYLDPADVRADLAAAGLTVTADLRREPGTGPGAEYPSRRCYLLASQNH